MYVVDIPKAGNYQKCYDPDCKGYRSPMRPVPPEVFCDYYDSIKEDEEQNGNESQNPMDSCQKDEWWREAIMVADKVENIPRKLDLAKEVTNLRSKKKVFISRGSYNSYRRLLPYLTDLGTDDSPSFEIVEPTMNKVQKPATIVPNTVAFKDKEIDTVSNFDYLADAKSSEKGLPYVTQKSHEDAIKDTLEECDQMTPPDSDNYSKPNIDKSSVKTSSNESNDSISTSKVNEDVANSNILKSQKIASIPDSWASNGNQPTKSDNTLEQKQQPPTLSLLNSDINMDDSLQPIT